MKSAFVFGYGSLVNRATHDYSEAYPARVRGWRRAWTHVTTRKVAFLNVIPDPDCEIDGVIAEVPDHAWQVLDERERSYDRLEARDVAHPLAAPRRVHIYHAPPHRHVPATTQHPVLMSYLDTVIQGFLREWGEGGVGRFFETTDGWDAPILDDRDDPVYPRHRPATEDERRLVDEQLNRLGARVIRGNPFPDGPT